MKKNIKKIFILIAIISSLWVIVGVLQWKIYNCNDIKTSFASDTKSMIAKFKANDQHFHKLIIARLKFEKPYKYPFFSPQDYGTSYYIDLQSFDSLTFVATPKDTLLTGALDSITYIPSEIKVFNRSHQQIVTYLPDTIYQDNISNYPKVSIFRQIVFWGPTDKDCD